MATFGPKVNPLQIVVVDIYDGEAGRRMIIAGSLATLPSHYLLILLLSFPNTNQNLMMRRAGLSGGTMATFGPEIGFTPLTPNAINRPHVFAVQKQLLASTYSAPSQTQ